MIRFWKDVRLNERPLLETCLLFFDICKEQDVTMHKAVGKNFNLSFRRRMLPSLLENGNYIKTMADSLNLSDSVW
jgi:hypothetical protein